MVAVLASLADGCRGAYTARRFVLSLNGAGAIQPSANTRRVP